VSRNQGELDTNAALRERAVRGQATEKERGGERNSGEIGRAAGAGCFGKAFCFKGF
jgi:hypothetical protein